MEYGVHTYAAIQDLPRVFLSELPPLLWAPEVVGDHRTDKYGLGKESRSRVN
jgi:hypothetical protein